MDGIEATADQVRQQPPAEIRLVGEIVMAPAAQADRLNSVVRAPAGLPGG